MDFHFAAANFIIDHPDLGMDLKAMYVAVSKLFHAGKISSGELETIATEKTTEASEKGSDTGIEAVAGGQVKEQIALEPMDKDVAAAAAHYGFMKLDYLRT